MPCKSGTCSIESTKFSLFIVASSTNKMPMPIRLKNLRSLVVELPCHYGLQFPAGHCVSRDTRCLVIEVCGASTRQYLGWNQQPGGSSVCKHLIGGRMDGYQAALLFIMSFVLNVSVCFVILMQLHLILKRLLCRASCLLPYVLLFFLLVLLHWIFSSFHIMMQLTENNVRVLHPTSSHFTSTYLVQSHLI